MSIANRIDHTLLKPACTSAEITQLCAEAKEFGFKAVCVPPYYVKTAHRLLQDVPIKIATVIGFPMGYSTIPAKVEEIKRAINDGVDEVDVVINLCAVKNSAWNYVKNDIDSTTRITHMRGKVIKTILETTLLTEQEIIQLCSFCNEFGVDFVKTSTGFQGAGATIPTIQLLKKHLSNQIKIKASGGIRTYQDALHLIEAGADRLGCSSSIAIMQGQAAAQ